MAATMSVETMMKKTEANGAVGKTKASLFNFVVYTHESRRVPYFEKLIQNVIKKFPCRILFIKGDADSSDQLFETNTSVLTAGNIACDYIEILASGTHLDQVPFYILPHLAPDLPVYLLWGHDPTQDSEILPKLKQYADRLIYDSECTKDLRGFSSNILAKRKEITGNVVDMNWARFAGWRNVLFNAFDTPESLEDLRSADSITIVYNGTQDEAFFHNATQAVYLQAWLGSRLGWSYVEAENGLNKKTITYFYEGHMRLKVDLIPEELQCIPVGSILSVEVQAKGGKEYHLVRHNEAPKQVKINVSTPEICEIPYTVPLLTQASGPTFIKELLYSEPSGHYEEMLKLLSGENL
jgi:glucose-6-phosphate dehydrogenase assembly protein OpcA